MVAGSKCLLLSSSIVAWIQCQMPSRLFWHYSTMSKGKHNPFLSTGPALTASLSNLQDARLSSRQFFWWCSFFGHYMVVTLALLINSGHVLNPLKQLRLTTLSPTSLTTMNFRLSITPRKASRVPPLDLACLLLHRQTPMPIVKTRCGKLLLNSWHHTVSKGSRAAGCVRWPALASALHAIVMSNLDTSRHSVGFLLT
jgi:hypothetical protein